MSGFFGAISNQDCVYDVFYGTDYHSHPGTKLAGMGIISDTDPQPFLKKKNHFTENFQGNVNPTEVVVNLIVEQDNFVTGLENVQAQVKGSCSMLLLIPDCILAARDKLERTPVIIGKREGAYAVASETASFPNTGYEIEYYLGPG